MTFEHDAVVGALAERASAQVRSGLHELHAGNYLAAEVFLNAACATLSSLAALLTEPPQKPPLRKFSIVGAQEEAIPRWMETKKGGPDGSAA